LLRLDVISGEVLDMNGDVDFDEDPDLYKDKVACLADKGKYNRREPPLVYNRICYMHVNSCSVFVIVSPVRKARISLTI